MKRLSSLLLFLALCASAWAGASYPSSVPSYRVEVPLDADWTEYALTDHAITVPGSPNANGDYVVKLDYNLDGTAATTVCDAVSGGGTCLTEETTGSPADGEFYHDLNYSRMLFNVAQANDTYYVTGTYYSTVNRAVNTNDHRADTEALIDAMLNEIIHDVLFGEQVHIDTPTNGTYVLQVTPDWSLGNVSAISIATGTGSPDASDWILDVFGSGYGWRADGVAIIQHVYPGANNAFDLGENTTPRYWGHAYITEVKAGSRVDIEGGDSKLAFTAATGISPSPSGIVRTGGTATSTTLMRTISQQTI
jgi:hypothetical protein